MVEKGSGKSANGEDCKLKSTVMVSSVTFYLLVQGGSKHAWSWWDVCQGGGRLIR